MTSLRKEVLDIFRKLHQTRKIVFKGDENALTAARKKINEEFASKKQLDDLKIIKEQIKHANEVELFMRKTVIQAVRNDTGNYRVVMRKDIELAETVQPYREMPAHKIGPFKKGSKTRPCMTSEDN